MTHKPAKNLNSHRTRKKRNHSGRSLRKVELKATAPGVSTNETVVIVAFLATILGLALIVDRYS
jgi:hypothetical protein